MIKKLLLLILCIVLYLFGNSQIYMGISGGANASNVRFDDADVQDAFRYKDKPHFGTTISYVSDFYFGQVLSLMVDAGYTVKGLKYKQTYSQGYKKFEFLQLIIAGKVDLNPEADFIVSPYIAPYGAYWLAGEKQHSDYKTGVIKEEKINLKNDTAFQYNRYDIGLVAGIDFKVKAGRKNYFIFGLRYEHGMLSSDIDKVDGWKNRNLNIYMKFLFRIKK